MRLMKIAAIGILAAGAAIGAALFSQGGNSETAPKVKEKMVEGDSIVVAGGCFWCLEPQFEMLKGVQHVEVGYAGGARPNPTYEQVSTGATGHAEAVKVVFDSKVISADDLLRIFFTIHDPTTKDRQGPDSGPQYRSTVFFSSEDEKARAQRIIDEIAKEGLYPDPIVTTLEPLENYTVAEDYHQDYFKKYEEASDLKKMTMNAGYCRVVVEPKVRKFREKFRHLLKDE